MQGLIVKPSRQIGHKQLRFSQNIAIAIDCYLSACKRYQYPGIANSHDPVTLSICSVPSRFCPNQAHLFPITPPWQPRLRRNPYPQLTNSASCPACFCLCRSQTSASHRQSSVSSKTPFAVLHPNRNPGKCRTPVKADLRSTTNPIRNQRCPPIKPSVSFLLFSIIIQDFFGCLRKPRASPTPPRPLGPASPVPDSRRSKKT